MSQGDQRYSGFRAGITACAAMPQVPGAASPENSLSPHYNLLRRTPREAYAKKKLSYSAALAASSPTGQKTVENNFKGDAHGNAILKRLHRKNYEIDFHGYSCFQALKELQDIIMSLTHNMKGKSKQHFTVITGKGNHSPGGKPVIRDAVWNYLKKNDIEYREQENNSGRTIIIVQFGITLKEMI